MHSVDCLSVGDSIIAPLLRRGSLSHTFSSHSLLSLSTSSVDWDKTEHTTTNYQNMGFASNPNAGFGRNKKPDLLQDKIPTADQLPLDTDLKLVLGQADTKGPPKRPASRQRTIIQRLIGTHGTDIEAMTKDRKLNTMQHTEAELKRLIYACSYWKEGSGVDFRVPRKSLWK
jgi:nucleolar protein 16